ncbi:MAG: AAA family ATPase [Spirochaetaceae bacterium]|nr:AAA family ATPase [Spirochaetaceae bacterium]
MSESETRGVNMAEAAAWVEYIERLRRYVATGRLDTDELNYKREVARELGGVREALLSGSVNWLDLLREVTPSYVINLCGWRGRDDLLNWFNTDPDGASDALLKLWAPYEQSPGAAHSAGDVIERVRAFAERLPQNVIRGDGTRMRLISFLLMGLDAERYPPFMTTAFAATYELAKCQGPPKDADAAALYEHALGFLDRLIEEADTLDRMRTRLEAQSAVFGVWYPVDRFNACSKGLSSALSKGNQHDAQEQLRKMSELLNRLEEHEPAGRHKEFSDRYRACKAEYEKRFDPPPYPPPDPQPDLQSLADELLLDAGALQKLRKLLDDKRQVIFQGPPGTGKTYVARKLAECLAGSPDRVWIVQFHPSYAYEDFVQGFRPTLQGGQPSFAPRNGPLLDAAEAADDKPGEMHFLVIDEINRGNLAKVFGELYFLLEYRGEQMRLQYADAGKRFALPKNLYFIGTMNTADRSIALVDLALRRRFHFVEFHPDKPPIQGLLRRWLGEQAPDMTWVAEVVDHANVKLDDRQAAIGPSYFMKPDLDKEMVDLIWEHNVLPYIEERFYGEHDRLDEFSLDKLLGETPTGSSGDKEQNTDAEGVDERVRELLDTSVDALQFSTDQRKSRVMNHLPPDVRTIRDLTRMTAEEIDDTDHIGIESRKEIESWLSEHRLKLGTDYGAVRGNLASGDDGDATT